MKKSLCVLGLAIISSSVFAHDIGAYAYSVTANKGTPVPVNSQHHARLINNTNATQTYIVNCSLCADNKGCAPPFHKVVNVSPHSQVRLKVPLYFDAVYRFTGVYNVYAVTEVLGDGGERRENRGTITIY